MDKQNRYVFSFNGLSPYILGDTVSVYLYGTYEGVEFKYEHQNKDGVKGYSVQQYCYNQLGKSTDAEFLTLLVDLLNFATSHQHYATYRLDSLLNADLTDAQKALATPYPGDAVDIANTSYVVIDNPTAKFNSGALSLESAVVVRYKITCEDLTGVSVKLTCDGQNYEIFAEDFIEIGNNQYYVDFDALKPTQMRSAIEATICRDGVAISNTLLYSIASYVARNADNASQRIELRNMLKAMLSYGDASYDYFVDKAN